MGYRQYMCECCRRLTDLEYDYKSDQYLCSNCIEEAIEDLGLGLDPIPVDIQFARHAAGYF